MNILQAIQSVLKLKPWVSMAEIRRLTKKSYEQIVTELGENRDLVWISTKTGRIVQIGTERRISALRGKAFAEGKAFKATNINYGAAQEIEVIGKFPTLDALRRDYWCGGLGDSYVMSKILVWSDEVKAELEKLGIPNMMDLYKNLTIEECWKS